MEMKENPKLDSDVGGESEDKISIQKNLVSDHINDDSFVIDMESFIHAGSNKESNPSSGITRSLSRKGSMRGTHDHIVTNSSSPEGSPEKLTAMPKGSTDNSGNPQMITITTGATESRFGLRKNSFKRSPSPWLLDPKRILFFFATLSSMGTVLLIYFTLSISGWSPDVNALD